MVQVYKLEQCSQKSRDEMLVVDETKPVLEHAISPICTVLSLDVPIYIHVHNVIYIYVCMYICVYIVMYKRGNTLILHCHKIYLSTCADFSPWDTLP